MQVTTRKSRFANEKLGHRKKQKKTIKYISDENSIFENYSKKGCIFECSVKFAIEKVGCLPWDFPVRSEWDDSDIDICYTINTQGI